MIGKVLFLIGNRHFLIRKCHFGIQQASYVVALRSPTSTTLVRSDSNDPPQPFHRRRSYRLCRPHRLLGYDGAQDRHDLPDHYRFLDLRWEVSSYSAPTVALRRSEIARTTVVTSSGTNAGGGAKVLSGRTDERA